MRKDCQRYQRLKEILGKRFGKLIANGFIKRGKKTLVKCKCDCGKQCLAYPGNLRAGNNQSCGIRKRHLVSSVCKQCKKEFKKTRHSMFCSDFCMNRSHQGYRGPEEKECLWCGKKFTNLKANKYCCAECRERHRWQGIYLSVTEKAAGGIIDGIYSFEEKHTRQEANNKAHVLKANEVPDEGVTCPQRKEHRRKKL